MATILKAGNVATGAQITSYATGILEVRTGTGAGTTAITVGTNQSVNFSGTAQRITGDFSNATLANRVMFQTSTANGTTSLGVMPNGTANFCAINFFNSGTDIANAGTAQISVSATEARFLTGITGTGTLLPMTFFTGGSETARFSATAKTLILSGGDTTANGTGITFPATQSASSNANTLDDYEEGTWTPTATPSSGSLTSSTRNGSYVKIGSVVVARFSILLTNVGTASGSMTIGALPFTVENTTGRTFIALVREDDQTGVAYQGCPIGNTTTASVHTLTNGSISWINNYRYAGCFTYIVA